MTNDLAIFVRSFNARNAERDAEAYTAYFERVGWAVAGEDGRLTATELGRAMSRALAVGATDSSDAIITTVLEEGDDYAYARTINTIAGLNDVLIVDPYIKATDLIELRGVASVKRVLTSDEDPRAKGKPSPKLNAFPILVPEDPAEFEVRVLPAAKMHDRYIIPGAASVIQMSTSFNSLGRRISVLTALSEVASGAVRREYTKLWGSAVRVERNRPPIDDAAVPDEPA